MATDSKLLDFGTTFKVFTGFLLLVAILVYSGFYLSQKRKQDVYNAYAKETQSWIQKNQAGLNRIFTELFHSTPCTAYDTPNTQASSSGYRAFECPEQEEIAKAVSRDLKDWSSTEFIKLDVDKVLVMGLSGATHEFYVYPEDKKALVTKLLTGQVSSIPWENYSSSMRTKEIIIPVKDSSGKILGAIVRGVIEQTN